MRRIAAAAAVLLGAALLLDRNNAPAAELVQPQSQTLRLANGAELWTIPYTALQQFVADGTFTDRRLLQLVANSGWPDAQLRVALAKPYAVEFVPLANFLYSPAGVAFLQQQTLAFRPLLARGRDLRVEGLRAAILRTAQSGTISAMDILKELPTTFVVEQGGPPTQRCSKLPCTNLQQCTSTLSWWVFLPACLQAAATKPAVPTALP
jgi:hypothetical protein